MLPKPAWTGFSVTYHQEFVTFFIHSSLPTHCSFIPSDSSSASRSHNSMSDLRPWNGIQKHFLLKPKQQDEEGERSAHFPHVSKHLDACQHKNRTSSFWSGNFGTLSMPKGLILMLSLTLKLTRICAELREKDPKYICWSICTTSS